MKKLLIALAVMLLLATLALGLAARLGGPRLLAHAIRSVGAGLGYQEIEVTVSEVGLRRTVLAAISAGPAPGLRASDVTLEYGPRSLLRGRVHTVRIGSAALHGVWNHDGMVFDALPPPSDGPWLAVPAWQHLVVDEGRVVLRGTRGPVTVSFARFSADAASGARLEARGIASIDSQAAPLDADFELVVDDDRLLGNARVKSRDGSLLLRGDFGAPGEGPGTFPTVAGPEELVIEGRIQLKADEADLSPFAPSFTAKGSVDLRSHGDRLRIRSDGLDLELLGLSLSDVAMSVDLTQLRPAAAPAGQRVSIGAARAGVPIGGGSLRFGLRDSAVLEIEALDWQLHGGTLRAQGAIDLDAEENRLTIGVQALDLGSLVASLERPDLSITGILSGELPLRVAGDRIFAESGRLSASEAGGVIHYGQKAPGLEDEGPPAKGSVGGVDLVLDALENFQYRTLEAQVDGELTGEMNLKVKLEGSNPDVYDGYPFQLNLNLEGPLADVVRGGTTGFRVQDAVEKRFQKRRE